MMADHSDNKGSSKRTARPFIPDVLEERETGYPAKDIFSGGLQESAGGYISVTTEQTADIIPTVSDPQPDTGTTPPPDATAELPEDTPNKKNLNDTEIEELKDQAFSEGYAKGKQEADTAIETYRNDTEKTVSALTCTLQTALKDMAANNAAIQDDLTAAALHIYRKLFKHATEEPEARASLLYDLLSEELSALNERIPENITITASTEDAAIINNLALNNSITCTPSAKQEPGHISITWQYGELSITPEHLEKELHKLI